MPSFRPTLVFQWYYTLSLLRNPVLLHTFGYSFSLKVSVPPNHERMQKYSESWHQHGRFVEVYR
ncbi:unnamed protein product [Haemonchus placei]|uniref:Secreted protein n=1 Tax=Haemonchus placei TaxID=6290 RepID=A0A0N4WHU6_HAEPC|nr:unnamed protein product [Haemonchus placei]